MHTVLAIVLHIGNLDFATVDPGDGEHYFDLRVIGPLGLVASLVGCETADLGNALVTNIMVMRVSNLSHSVSVSPSLSLSLSLSLSTSFFFSLFFFFFLFFLPLRHTRTIL